MIRFTIQAHSGNDLFYRFNLDQDISKATAIKFGIFDRDSGLLLVKEWPGDIQIVDSIAGDITVRLFPQETEGFGGTSQAEILVTLFGRKLRTVGDIVWSRTRVQESRPANDPGIGRIPKERFTGGFFGGTSTIGDPGGTRGPQRYPGGFIGGTTGISSYPDGGILHYPGGFTGPTGGVGGQQPDPTRGPRIVLPGSDIARPDVTVDPFTGAWVGPTVDPLIPGGHGGRLTIAETIVLGRVPIRAETGLWAWAWSGIQNQNYENIGNSTFAPFLPVVGRILDSSGRGNHFNAFFNPGASPPVDRRPPVYTNGIRLGVGGIQNQRNVAYQTQFNPIGADRFPTGQEGATLAFGQATDMVCTGKFWLGAAFVNTRTAGTRTLFGTWPGPSFAVDQSNGDWYMMVGGPGSSTSTRIARTGVSVGPVIAQVYRDEANRLYVRANGDIYSTGVVLPGTLNINGMGWRGEGGGVWDDYLWHVHMSRVGQTTAEMVAYEVALNQVLGFGLVL